MATTIVTCYSSKPPILSENCSRKPLEFEELIIPDEIYDLLRWSDWVRAYRATAEFFDRKLASSREQQ